MQKRFKTILYNALYATIAVAIVLIVWEIGAFASGTELVLPNIATTFASIGEALILSAFWTGLSRTLMRVAFSFALSVLIAFILFFLCAISKPFSKIVLPLVSALRALPTMAVSLILAIWAGANIAPVILGVLVLMPIILSAALSKIEAMDRELIEQAKILGAGKIAIFFNVVMPQVASALPETLSSALSFGVKIIIAAEILMQTGNSLGMLMYLAKTYLQTAMLIAYVLIAVIVSVLLEFSLKFILRKALKKYT